MTNFDELRRLAENAAEEDGWHNAAFLGAFIDEDDAPVFNGDDTAFIEAASPRTILELLDRISSSSATETPHHLPSGIHPSVYYAGQHEDCIATTPHYHQRPYQPGDWGATETPDGETPRYENCRICDLTYPAGTEHRCTDGWTPTPDDRDREVVCVRPGCGLPDRLHGSPDRARPTHSSHYFDAGLRATGGTEG